jgi:prepilin-type N-terminal cleavage/methylation domain-containing protein
MRTLKRFYANSRPTPKREEGFTIIEVLLAVTLLAIGLLAISSMQVTAIQGNASARRQTERSTFAQDKIEELMAIAYTHNDLDPAGNPHTDPNPPANYSIIWTVANDIPVPNSKLINVTVTGVGKTVQMTCVKPNL